jgi:hypothetical protein
MENLNVNEVVEVEVVESEVVESEFPLVDFLNDKGRAKVSVRNAIRDNAMDNLSVGHITDFLVGKDNVRYAQIATDQNTGEPIYVKVAISITNLEPLKTDTKKPTNNGELVDPIF